MQCQFFVVISKFTKQKKRLFDLNFNFNFFLSLSSYSDRLDVYECINHKWLKMDTPNIPQTILTVQTSNVTITTNPADESVDVIKCTTTTHVTTQTNIDDNILTNGTSHHLHHHYHHHLNEDDEEDKENSRQITASITALTNVEQETSVATISFHHNPSAGAKLVLEKSSISLFPDAPTTPKVCRKTIYEDEANLKEIVKKYQSSTAQAQCCGDDESECLVCHPKIPATKPLPSLELDKGITSC